MKLILGIVLVGLFSTTAKAQNLDSLKAEIVGYGDRIDRIQENLYKAHEQFRTGTIVVGIGATLMLGSLLVKEGDDGNKANKVFVLTVGSGFVFVGAIFMIDSHKYIGRAGRWGVAPGSVTYNLTR